MSVATSRPLPGAIFWIVQDLELFYGAMMMRNPFFSRGGFFAVAVSVIALVIRDGGAVSAFVPGLLPFNGQFSAGSFEIPVRLDSRLIPAKPFSYDDIEDPLPDSSDLPQPTSSWWGEKGFKNPLAELSDMVTRFDDVVDDFMGKKMGNGELFYGKRKYKPSNRPNTEGKYNGMGLTDSLNIEIARALKADRLAKLQQQYQRHERSND
jgi:hypothetical protein